MVVAMVAVRAPSWAAGGELMAEGVEGAGKQKEEVEDKPEENKEEEGEVLADDAAAEEEEEENSSQDADSNFTFAGLSTN